MDGKGHPDSHSDPRAQEPHAHVPDVTNDERNNMVANTLEKVSIMNKETEDNKFTWNDVVVIKNYAPKSFHPREMAAVCGMERV